MKKANFNKAFIKIKKVLKNISLKKQFPKRIFKKF